MVHEIFRRELSIPEMLAHSWKLFKGNFKLVLFVTLLVYVPINIIIEFIPFDSLIQKDPIAGIKLYLRAIQFLESFIGILATLAVAFAIKSRLSGRKVDFKASMKKAVSRWLPAIGTGILMRVFLLGLFLLLIVPGVIYSIYWTFALYAVVLHDKTWKAALDYSKSVVKGRWWKVFGYSLVFVIISSLVVIVFAIPTWFLPDDFLLNILSTTLIDVVASFFIVLGAVFFINFDSTKLRIAGRKTFK